MRAPLVPVVLILALFIFISESLTGCFTRWLNPARSPSHYSHYLCEHKVENVRQWLLVRITDMPEQRQRSVRCQTEVLQITDSSGAAHHCHGKLLIYLPHTTLHLPDRGDELLLLSTPQQPPEATNPHQFDYRRHLSHNGILATAYIPDGCWKTIGHHHRGLIDGIADFRHRLIAVIRSSSLSSSQQGIAEALLLGWKGDLEPHTEQSFRQAGITHLLCVSGLHVGIVTLLAGWMLSFLGNRRRSRIVRGLFQIAVTWLFVVITGMAPSTVRAGLMFSMVVAGQMFFCRPPTLNAIAASALILLVINPLLLFDVGFQLSYCSVTAIVLFVRPLEETIPLPVITQRHLRWLAEKIRSLFCVSLVAQLAVTPLTLYYFHQFPLFFLVANMVVVPFAGLLLGTVLVMVSLAWWPGAFNVVATLLSLELSGAESVTSMVASWPMSMIENIWFDGWMLALAMAIVAALGLMLVKRLRLALPSALAMALLLTLHARSAQSRCDTQLQWTLYDVGNRTAIEFFIGHESVLICDSNTAHHPDKIDYQTSNNLLWHQTKKRHIVPVDSSYSGSYLLLKNRFVDFNGTTFRIVDRSNCRQQSTFQPRVNYLLLRESPYITIAELKRQYLFDTVLICSQNSQRRRLAWLDELQ